MLAVDTASLQFFVDLVVKVKSKNALHAGIHQTFNWITNTIQRNEFQFDQDPQRSTESWKVDRRLSPETSST